MNQKIAETEKVLKKMTTRIEGLPAEGELDDTLDADRDSTFGRATTMKTAKTLRSKKV